LKVLSLNQTICKAQVSHCERLS